MRPQAPPNRQTIASLAKEGMTFGGLCANAHPARFVDVDMAVLIARLGPDCTVPSAMRKIGCRVCGARVPVIVRPHARPFPWPDAWRPVTGAGGPT